MRDGDIADGVSLTLSAAKGLGHEVRVLSVGVRDVLSAVPAGYRSEELDELRAFAATGPCPWETIA